MKRYEYIAVDSLNNSLIDEINKFAKQGYRLMNVIHNGMVAYAFMERESVALLT